MSSFFNHCVNDENKICPRAIRNNKIILVIGKSGAGKDMFTKNMISINKVENESEGCPCKKINIDRVKQYTTRPMRTNEVDGKDYIFIKSDDELKTLLSRDELFDIRSYSILNPDTTSGVWYYAVNIPDINLASGSYIITGPSTDPLKWVEQYVVHFGSKNIVMVYIDTPNNDIFEYALHRETSKDESKRNYSELCRRYLDNVSEYDFMDSKIKEFVKKYDIDFIHVDNKKAAPADLYKRFKEIYMQLIKKITK